jgi:hypothetical protein
MVRFPEDSVIVKPPDPLETRSLEVPRDLPFLASLSWSDRRYRELPPQDMLSRYEAGWRHRGVLADPSEEELGFIRALVARYGSWIRV